MTLDYRSPQTHEHRVQKVLTELSQDEVIGLMTTILKVVVGVPLCFLLPLLVTAILKRGDYRFHVHALPDFGILFAVFSLIAIPILFWFQRHGKQQLLWDNLQYEPELPRYGNQVMWTAGHVFLLLEVALFGPKLLWSVWDAFDTRGRIDPPTRTAAAALVVSMLEADRAFPISGFVSAQFTREEIISALKYLNQRGWITFSRKQDRVRLSSSVRKQFKDL